MVETIIFAKKMKTTLHSICSILLVIFFINKGIDENIVTGIILTMNLLLCAYYYKRIRLILFEK